MGQRPNARAGDTGDPGENPPTSGIVQHDSHTRKSWGDKPMVIRLAFSRDGGGGGEGRGVVVVVIRPRHATCRRRLGTGALPPVRRPAATSHRAERKHTLACLARGPRWCSRQTSRLSNQANRIRFPAVSLLDFRMWESCRTMSLVGGFSRRSAVFPHPCNLSLTYTHFTSPSSALKPSIFVKWTPGGRGGHGIDPTAQRPNHAFPYTVPLLNDDRFAVPHNSLSVIGVVSDHPGIGRGTGNGFNNVHCTQQKSASKGVAHVLGSPLVDDRPVMNAVKCRVVPGVVWTNRTMVRNNTDTNITGVLAVVDIDWHMEKQQPTKRCSAAMCNGDSHLACEKCQYRLVQPTAGHGVCHRRSYLLRGVLCETALTAEHRERAVSLQLHAPARPHN
ncbi:hypothetical protein PR048_006796 [Dryococelus australis]|uniref:Uncharacterized protein n=1 Tax=Dryococelus australis TaxID=614101 RepID=A0ABQ9ICY0_9NEOP|nr:hypothetical protein PR048_006796 [Dryococelus australis]